MPASRSCESAAAAGRARDLPLEPRRDLGGGALRLARLRAEPPPARRPLGRPDADPRPRLGHRRLGALGQRLVPAHRRARLRRRLSTARRGLLPALPADARRRSAARSAATTSLAGIVVSLAAALVAFVLLHRLAEERLGADGARRAVLYLAVFPMALFLQAVYSESLFLALGARRVRARASGGAGSAAGARDRARDADADRRRRAAAGARAARVAVAGRRSARSRASASRRRIFAAYPLYLGLARGRRVARSRARRASGTATSRTPARSAGSGTGCARPGPGIEQLAPDRTPILLDGRCRTPTRCASPPSTSSASRSSSLLVALTVVAWRRFGAPYGLFAAVSLAIPLSVPSSRWPLLSMPRFGLVALPVLPRARGARRAAAGAHRDRGRQLGDARRRRHPMGALAMGRVAVLAVFARPRRDRLRRALGADRVRTRTSIPSRSRAATGRSSSPARRSASPSSTRRRRRSSTDSASGRGSCCAAAETSSDLRAVRRAHPDLIVACEDANEHDLSRAASATRAQDLHRAGRLDPPGRAGDHPARTAHRRAGEGAHARAAASRRAAARSPTALAGVADVSVFVDVGFLNTISRPVADRRRAPRGARDERGRRTGEAGPVDIRRPAAAGSAGRTWRPRTPR